MLCLRDQMRRFITTSFIFSVWIVVPIPAMLASDCAFCALWTPPGLVVIGEMKFLCRIRSCNWLVTYLFFIRGKWLSEVSPSAISHFKMELFLQRISSPSLSPAGGFVRAMLSRSVIGISTHYMSRTLGIRGFAEPLRVWHLQESFRAIVSLNSGDLLYSPLTWAVVKRPKCMYIW